MAEGPRRDRRRGGGELPPPDFNPDMEKLIDSASKGSETVPKEEAQSNSPQEKILSRDSDAWVAKQLERLDSLAEEPSVQPEQMIESPTAEEIQRDLDETLTDTGKRTLDNFIKILGKAEIEGGGAISLDWVEKIGIAAAKRLSGKDFNDFKRYVVPKYELNEVKDIHPELDFLRIEPERNIDIPENLPIGTAVEQEKIREELTPSKDVQFEPATIESKRVSESLPVVSSDEDAVYVILDPKTPLTDAQRARFAEIMGDTPKEKRSYLYDLIKKAKGKLYATDERLDVAGASAAEVDLEQPISQQGERIEKKKGRAEALRSCLAGRSEELQAESKKQFGEGIAHWITATAENYNKLDWKSKLALTGGLMLGAGLTATAAPWVSSAFGVALWGQRTVGGLGTFMNRRKDFDKNPESWLAKQSNGFKNTYALVLTMVWTMGTSFVVHEGVEGLKALSQTDVFDDVVEKAKEISKDGLEKVKFDWLRTMLDRAPDQAVTESVVSDTASVASGQEEVVEIPPASPEDISVVPQEDVALPPLYSGQYIEEQYGGSAAFEKTPEQLRALAADSLIKDLKPEHQALVDNHISSLSPAGRHYFNQFSEEIKSNPEAAAPTGAYPSAQVDAAIDRLKGHLDTMQGLANQQEAVLNDASHAPMSVSAAPPESAQGFEASPQNEEGLMQSRVKGLNEEWNKLYAEREQVRSDVAIAQAESSANAAQELSAKEAHISQQMSNIKKSIEDTGAGTPYGRDPLDGHPMSQMEAQKLEELQASMRHPGGSHIPEEKTFFNTVSDWFTKDTEARTEGADSSHFETNGAGLAVDTAHANIFLDSQNFRIAFGGSAEDRAREALSLVSKNHSEVVYFGSERPGGFLNLFTEHHLHKVFWPEGAEKPIIVDDATEPSLRGNLPSIDDLKQLYKPSK